MKMSQQYKIFIISLLSLVILILYLTSRKGGGFQNINNTNKSPETSTSYNNRSMKDSSIFSQMKKSSKSTNPGFGNLILKIFHQSFKPKTKESVILNGTKVLSYCVFGVNSFQKYKEEMKAVARESAKSQLYGKEKWQVRIYTDIHIPIEYLAEIQNINPRISFINVTDNLRKINGMIWRFLPISEITVDVVCFRDLDSALYKREEAAVREYLANSKYICHMMRDHPQHYSPIMGGLWCFKNKLDPQLGKTLWRRIQEKAEQRIPGVQEARKGDDQDVLSRHVWPVVIDKTMVHDSFFCYKQPGGRPFPTKRNLIKEPFVGCAKRPCHCKKKILRCPKKCRPRLHKDWIYC